MRATRSCCPTPLAPLRFSGSLVSQEKVCFLILWLLVFLIWWLFVDVNQGTVCAAISMDSNHTSTLPALQGWGLMTFRCSNKLSKSLPEPETLNFSNDCFLQKLWILFSSYFVIFSREGWESRIGIPMFRSLSGELRWCGRRASCIIKQRTHIFLKIVVALPTMVTSWCKLLVQVSRRNNENLEKKGSPGRKRLRRGQREGELRNFWPKDASHSQWCFLYSKS